MANSSNPPVKWYYFLALGFTFITLDVSTAHHRQALKIGDWNVSITTNPTQHEAKTANMYRQYRRDDDSGLDPKKLVQALEGKIIARVAKEANVSFEKPKPQMSALNKTNRFKRHLQLRESPKLVLKPRKLQGKFNEGPYERKAYAENINQVPMRNSEIARDRTFGDNSNYHDNRNKGINAVKDNYENDYGYDVGEDDGFLSKDYFENPHPRRLNSNILSLEDTVKSNYGQRRAPTRESNVLNDDDNDDDDDDDDDAYEMSQRGTENLEDGAEATAFLEDSENYKYLNDPENNSYLSDDDDDDDDDDDNEDDSDEDDDDDDNEDDGDDDGDDDDDNDDNEDDGDDDDDDDDDDNEDDGDDGDDDDDDNEDGGDDDDDEDETDQRKTKALDGKTASATLKDSENNRFLNEQERYNLNDDGGDDDDDDDDDGGKTEQMEADVLDDAVTAAFLEDPENYKYLNDPESYGNLNDDGNNDGDDDDDDDEYEMSQRGTKTLVNAASANAFLEDPEIYEPESYSYLNDPDKPNYYLNDPGYLDDRASADHDTE